MALWFYDFLLTGFKRAFWDPCACPCFMSWCTALCSYCRLPRICKTWKVGKEFWGSHAALWFQSYKGMALIQPLFWEPSRGILFSEVPFCRKKCFIKEVATMEKIKDIIINWIYIYQKRHTQAKRSFVSIYILDSSIIFYFYFVYVFVCLFLFSFWAEDCSIPVSEGTCQKRDTDLGKQNSQAAWHFSGLGTRHLLV